MSRATLSVNQKLERAIVAALVRECARAGYVPEDVFNGEEYVKATNIAAVLEAVFSVDESTIHFKGGDKHRSHGVFIVCGNGEDCISDYHCGDPAFTTVVEHVCNAIDDANVSLSLNIPHKGAKP